MNKEEKNRHILMFSERKRKDAFGNPYTSGGDRQMYVFLSSFLFIMIFCSFASIVAMAAAFEKGKKVATIISYVLFIATTTLVFASMAGQDTEATNYSALIDIGPIDFVKEDRITGRIIYGHDGEQYIEESKNCKIILADVIPSSSESSVSSFTALPYYQCEKTEKYKVAKLFAFTARSRPEVTYQYYFYVSKTYLDDSDFDWSLLTEAEPTNPE